MAYYGQGHPSKRETAIPYPSSTSHWGVPPQFQGSTPTVNGQPPVIQNHQLPNGQFDIKHGSPNVPQHHRPPKSTQDQQQASQKAFAVAIPPPSSSPMTSVGRSASPNRHQPALSSASQDLSTVGHKYSDTAAQEQTLAEPPLDYPLLLISLAEEYFAAAYGCGSIAATAQRGSDTHEYYKMIATGLGCLEAVLSHFELLPEREAMVRLRYAMVLFEETENMMEAEEALSKGISLCDRHRFFDIKYNMQHLLARMLFEKNPRAAFKFLDGVLKDVEAYQHIAWVYAFRFLKVSLHLKLSTHQDMLSALSQLRHLITVSNGYGDKTLLAIATLIEALTALRGLNDPDSVEQAQLALSSVRSLQLDPQIGAVHQLEVLSSIVDLCCHLQQFDPAKALNAMRVMQTAMKNMQKSTSWAADGSFPVHIPGARMQSCKSQSGIVRKRDDGSLALMCCWMSKDDIYNLGYLLSGIALASRNTRDGRKSEHMLEEGIEKMSNVHKDKSRQTLPRSLAFITSEQTQREQMVCYMRLHLAFRLCARTAWSAAKEQQSLIQSSIKIVTATSKPLPESLQVLPTYLEAVICQGTGNLDRALSIYQSDTCSLQAYRKKVHPSQLHLNVVLASTLNALLIIRTPSHPRHDNLAPLLSFLEHLCKNHPNRQIQSAFQIVTATAPSSSTITVIKSALSTALEVAKECGDDHLMCVVLNLMAWKFFRGVVNPQSERAAKASEKMAQKCMDTLWISVAAGLLGDTLELEGKIEEAQSARESGEATARDLPEALQVVMRREMGEGTQTVDQL